MRIRRLLERIYIVIVMAYVPVKCMKSAIIIYQDRKALGLTNQLYDLSTIISFACANNISGIHFPIFNLDYSKGKLGHTSIVLDVEATNSNIPCTRLIALRELVSYNVVHISDLLSFKKEHSLQRNLSHLAGLQFSKTLHLRCSGIASKMAISKLFYGVHLRMELDWIIFAVEGGPHEKNPYFRWLELQNSNLRREAEVLSHSLLETPKYKVFINCELGRYVSQALEVFHDKRVPIMIATGLGGPSSYNGPLDWVLKNFSTTLEQHGFKVVRVPKSSVWREINAAIDMIFMKQSIAFIGNMASTFSQAIQSFKISDVYSIGDQNIPCPN